ncbi:MAG: hypothetical protein ABSH20_23340 [Tepidisphaeraceae bacterium]|jgi:hypothetical protein
MPDDRSSSVAPHGEVVKLEYASGTAGGVVTEENAEGIRFLLPRGTRIIAIAAAFGLGVTVLFLVVAVLKTIHESWAVSRELVILIAFIAVTAGVALALIRKTTTWRQPIEIGANAAGLSVAIPDHGGAVYFMPREHLEQVWLVRGWIHIDLNTTWRLVVQTDEGLYSMEFELARTVPGGQIEGRLRHALDLPKKSQHSPSRFFMYWSLKRWRVNRPSATHTQ